MCRWDWRRTIDTSRRDTGLAEASYAALNRLDPLKRRCRIDVDQFEAKSEICFFVQLSKSDGIGDGLRHDEAELPSAFMEQELLK
jgi:hypothetical protein